MSSKKGSNGELTSSYRQFDKLLRYALIIGIIIVSGFLLYYLLTPEPGYVSFGILNSEKEAGNYPVSVEVGDNVSFYLIVGNYLGRTFSFRIEVLKSNITEVSHPSNRLNTLSVFNTSIISLKNQKEWKSDQFNVSFNEAGVNRTIIAELWEVTDEVPGSFYTSLFLRLNVTA
jgi:uncharacterized membrane protein